MLRMSSFSSMWSACNPVRSAGFHITCGENPWNQPTNGVHVGEMMEEYGGGGHRAVGGANPPSLAEAKRLGEQVAIRIKDHLASA